jgi:hypothetical protein
MDVVAAMFSAAEDAGVLPSLPAGLKHRVSLYADDVVVFARPVPTELAAIRGILSCFGNASGLHVNFGNSSAAPIQCSEEDVEIIAPAIECPIRPLPCTYLGLPLSLKKLRKEDLQLVLDRLARKLAFWKAKLMSKDGRVAYVQAVMTASVIYHLLALDVDPWFIKAVDKLRRGFLWVGKSDARGGCCLVAWDQVCQPKHLGGLGLLNLTKLNAALRARWLWFQKADLEKPWAGLALQVSPHATAIFNASVSVSVGDGSRTLFWVDPWIGGLTAEAIAPAVVRMVRPGIKRNRTVQHGLQGASWLMDIAGELSVDAVVQFLKLWHELRDMSVSAGDDVFSWKWTANGQFTSKTAYRAFFFGRTALPGADQVWNAFAPFKVQFHAWLALRNRCWTAERLTRRGLPTHTLCPLCDAVAETMDHLSLQCVFSISVWATTCQQLQYGLLQPTSLSSLATWWPSTVAGLSRRDSRTANSLIMLIMRSLWLERNARVFDGVRSSAAIVARRITEEWALWISVRRRGGRVRDVA